MEIEQVTAAPTEADLEARIHAALRSAFPWLRTEELRHQTKFVIRSGRSSIAVDGAVVSRAEARADVLVYHQDKPLAVLELKRPGLTLTAADDHQGLSYARMLNPHPPLVVISNGSETRFLATHSGAVWQPENPSAAAVAELVTAAARVAAQDLDRAVEVLLGPATDVWVEAVRQATRAVIMDLSGDWDEPLRPFVPDFLIPRLATQAVFDALSTGHRLVMVEGAPLAGKSSVLRDLAARTEQSGDMAVLLMEADGGARAGVFRSLANLLAGTLGWSVTAEDARQWLRRLSQRQLSPHPSPALVLAIDGMGPDRDELRKDIEELSSDAFGVGVRIVFAVDDTVAHQLVMSASSRKQTLLGRRAKRIEVGPFEDAEFRAAATILWNSRIAIILGGERANELRVPWVLRSLCAHVAAEMSPDGEHVITALPPLLSLDLIHLARERFEVHGDELQVALREVARAVLQDSEDRSRPVPLVLVSVATFVVRRDTLLKHVGLPEVERLVGLGVLKLTVDESGEGCYVVRLPELLAAVLAALLGGELARRLEDPSGAAEWLAERAAALPLGDIIGAQAVLDAAAAIGSLPVGIIQQLMVSPPKQETLVPGSRVALRLPNGLIIEAMVQGDGSLHVRTQGQRVVIPMEPEADGSRIYENTAPWLILSHLAGIEILLRVSDEHPSAGVDDDQFGSVDSALLLHVGTCPMVLRPAAEHPKWSSAPTHNMHGHGSVVCHEAGIIEPITWSLFRFLNREGPNATAWIQAALDTGSFPLLSRLDIALRELAGTADTTRAEWAKRMLNELVHPAYARYSLLH